MEHIDLSLSSEEFKEKYKRPKFVSFYTLGCPKVYLHMNPSNL